MNLVINGLLFVVYIMITSSCQQTYSLEPESHVSKDLSDHRHQVISKIRYELILDIPLSVSNKILGEIGVYFSLQEIETDLVLDFYAPKAKIHTLLIDGENTAFRRTETHIIIPKEYLVLGQNHIWIDFEAGEQALNRNPEYLYTLFVPNKASTAFPCFDQPNLKANYSLTLKVPPHWEAVSNAPGTVIKETKERKTLRFKETLPISSYLFAFAAGEFQIIQKEMDGRTMNLYHRETNPSKIQQNAEEAFGLHAKSLAWLEDYTGIPYPFQKFDFVLLPAFQFGGMEHPGAIFYRASSIFLEENATINNRMSRNSLIAHETAHMWFGDLVTMEWFNDVWLKEVFANFMAAKMVHPNFPEIDHDLRFLHNHQPTAYGEDRTAGSHPIQQVLPNLNEASLLYGRIIYQKAPVVMKQLENIMGKEAFQEGLQEYLRVYSFDNATWDDLVAILNERTPIDLNAWSQVWVKEAGMPHIKAILDVEHGKILRYKLQTQNTTSSGNTWNQDLKVAVGFPNGIEYFPITLDSSEIVVDGLQGKPVPNFILPHGNEGAYGFFELDTMSHSFLEQNVHLLQEELLKQATWLTFYESLLRRKISSHTFLATLIRGLANEKTSLGLQSRLQYLQIAYWGFIGEQERKTNYKDLPETLWLLLGQTQNKDHKKHLFDAFISMAIDTLAIQKLYDLWQGDLSIEGIDLSENDQTRLAYELVIKDHPEAEEILARQLNRIQNPDRKWAMEFVIPALSASEEKRDEFFASLSSEENRTKEPWVLTALNYLHHPLRAKSAEKYIEPSLKMVKEIQETGGIFFPKSWTTHTLNGHRSPEAARLVQSFLEDLPSGYPYKLKNKILQGSDLLMRKAENTDGNQ